MWNILFSKVGEDKVIRYDCVLPEKSGRYLCTCIRFYDGKEVNRYLQLMEFDKERNHFHDCGNKSVISHIIMAWSDEKPSNFNNFEYHRSGYITPN